jgi:type I restriction enzyme S subunit
MILRLDEGSKDSAVPGLAREDAYNLNLPVCSVYEQQVIASFLDNETDRIDFLRNKIQTSIFLLREYRASLIHHAVTGKIDLRGYDAQAQ